GQHAVEDIRDRAAVALRAATAVATAVAPLATVAAAGKVAEELAVGDGEDSPVVVDGPPEGPPAGPAGIARAASAARPANGLVAAEDAIADCCQRIAFDIQGPGLGGGAIRIHGSGVRQALVASEGAVHDVHDGLAPHARLAQFKEASAALVRFN